MNRKFTGPSTLPKVRRANLDGSLIEDLVTTDLSYPYGIALDLESSEMYFSDLNNDAIYKSNFDGINKVTLITGLNQPPPLPWIFSSSLRRMK